MGTPDLSGSNRWLCCSLPDESGVPHRPQLSSLVVVLRCARYQLSPHKIVASLPGLWLDELSRRSWESCQEGQLVRMGRKRLHVFYSGRVQGVGFRFTVKSLAQGFEVTGVVRNLLDGRVELVAEGAGDELEAFRAAVRESELAPFIRQEEINWGEPKNEFRGFEIVR